jgi:ABC-2 type transport system ATP-binding protein
MTIAIEGSGLEKSFVKKRSILQIATRPFQRARRVDALRGIDLQIRQGEIFGLLGPNGAGKTTLLKIFSCLILPDRGRAVIDGTETTHENVVKRRIGLVHSDERSFYWRLTGRENMRFFAVLYDVPRADAETRIEQLLLRVDMLQASDRPFSDYSSGMKQRMAIARAMLHDPPILLMDEPTRSLDPSTAMELRSFILNELKPREGKTILIASHNLRELETLADRIAVLVQGKIRRVGTVGEVKQLGVDEQRFVLELEPGAQPLSGPCRVHSDETVEGVRKVTLTLDQGARLDELLRVLLDAGFAIRACDRVEPDLEQAFCRLVGAAGAGE